MGLLDFYVGSRSVFFFQCLLRSLEAGEAVAHRGYGQRFNPRHFGLKGGFQRIKALIRYGGKRFPFDPGAFGGCRCGFCGGDLRLARGDHLALLRFRHEDDPAVKLALLFFGGILGALHFTGERLDGALGQFDGIGKSRGAGVVFSI